MRKIISGLIKNKEVLLYLFFGVLTTIVSFLTYTLFTRVMAIDELVANVLSWVFAVAFAYITNKNFVFDSRHKSLKATIKELVTFFTARLFSLAAETAIMYIGIRIFSFYDLYVKLFGQIVVVILNYVLSKYLIFKKEDDHGKN
ncbi:MAG: GtrA family protein [Erysipelotrichaceae bacterium]|nr:GtrA family protein [Erysipelotrichaceae bacterium]